jgi:HSP20 family protein
MLTRYDPFAAADRMLGRAFPAPPMTMPMDAVRRDDALLIEFDLPGVDPDTIDMTLERDVLVVTAERPAPQTQGTQVLARERPHGRFSRRLLLGKGIDAERIDAAYDAGVLRVVVPVAEGARPRRITIEHGDGAQAISATAR